MKRLHQMFQRRKTEGEAAFIAYVTCGDPSKRATVDIISAMIDAGADAIELGIPFSDPIADGPVIQAAAQRALANGTSIVDVFDVARQIRARHTEVPLIAFSYLNPVLSLGRGGANAFEAFGDQAVEAGIDALLITDLPSDEARDARRTLTARGLGLVPLVAPTSPRKRMEQIGRAADGFIYYVSANGVTGARSSVDPRSLERVVELRTMTHKPIAVGFGVSTAEQFAAIAEVADAVVVGSAIVRAIADGAAEGAASRAAEIVRAIRGRA